MTELGPDELHLKGRVQVEIAIGALAYTGINLEALNRLQALLDVHAQLSNGQNQNDLSVYMRGEIIKREKVDIITSLDTVCIDKDTTNETRLAAQALREII